MIQEVDQETGGSVVLTGKPNLRLICEQSLGALLLSTYLIVYICLCGRFPLHIVSFVSNSWGEIGKFVPTIVADYILGPSAQNLIRDYFTHVGDHGVSTLCHVGLYSVNGTIVDYSEG